MALPKRRHPRLPQKTLPQAVKESPQRATTRRAPPRQALGSPRRSISTRRTLTSSQRLEKSTHSSAESMKWNALFRFSAGVARTIPCLLVRQGSGKQPSQKVWPFELRKARSPRCLSLPRSTHLTWGLCWRGRNTAATSSKGLRLFSSSSRPIKMPCSLSMRSIRLLGRARPRAEPLMPATY